MQMKDVVLTRIDDNIRGNEEAMRYMGEIIKNFPREVFETDIDDTQPTRKAVMCGDGACKFGVYPQITQAFLEYYDSHDDTEPSMVLHIDAEFRSVNIIVRKPNKTMEVKFFVDDEEVKKIMRVE